MNKKVIELSPENIAKIILKRPKETARHTVESPEYISEVWYLDDDRLYQPIVQTPRLKIKYGARKWSGAAEASPSVSWSYCVGLYNYDIDPEIKRFYDSIKDYDKHIISYWTSNKKSWNLRQHAKIKAKYFTALRRRERDDDPYLCIKLISDKDGKVLTSINTKERGSDPRRDLSPEEIKYGKYVDQYVSPSFVLFNSTGIHPYWQAHQVVISPIERIFLENCLLDVLDPQLVVVPVPPPLAPLVPLAPPVSVSSTLSQKSSVSANPGALLGLIKKDDLLNAIDKLKSTKPSTIPKGERNRITASDIQMQRTKMQQNAKRVIMFNSIKGMPIEGDPDNMP